MDISIRREGAFAIIKFNKKTLLGTESMEFQSNLVNILDKGTSSVIIDLSMVEYVTSWAIGMLVHAFTTTTNRHTKFVLEGVSQKVKDTLTKIRLDKVFEIQ